MLFNPTSSRLMVNLDVRFLARDKGSFHVAQASSLLLDKLEACVTCVLNNPRETIVLNERREVSIKIEVGRSLIPNPFFAQTQIVVLSGHRTIRAAKATPTTGSVLMGVIFFWSIHNRI
jgi:hypothetical protein